MNTPCRVRCPLAFAAAALALAAAVAVVVAGLGYRAGWWHFLSGLRVAEWAVYASGLALAISFLAAWRSRPGTSRRGFVVALAGIALSLPVVVMALQWEFAARAHPPINDITTDLGDPPVFWEMPNPADHPGPQVAELQRQGYPDIAPLNVAKPPQRAFEQAQALVRERGWEVVAADDIDLRIEATATSQLYGFTDEVVIRISEAGEGARIDMRSRSRLGRIDRGTNAARIKNFLNDLERRIGAD